MPSVKEIHKYIEKHVLPTVDLSEYQARIAKTLERRLNKDRASDDIMWGAISIAEYIKRTRSILCLTLVLNNKEFNKELCEYYVSSSLMMLFEYYNNLNNESFSESLSSQGCSLLMAFACNRFELIEPCYPKIIESILSGKMSRSLPWGGDGNGNDVPPQPQRLGVLAIEMMASEKKQTIDWASANIPVDPFYQRFCQEALYSTDDQELIYWLTKLCDNHLQWTSLFMDNAVKQPSTGYEIYDNMLLLWPFEYQAVKNFRARHGLSTPQIDHPLLKTPMAIDHRPNFAVWQKPEWLDVLVDKVTEVNPELNFVRTWFK